METVIMNQPLRLKRIIDLSHYSVAFLLLSCTQQVMAQDQSERLSRVTNQSSQRYEINQTFGRQAFRKHNNI